VSIIIPVFNSQEYLGETIKSALAQTWPNKEIIVVDDGSTDESLSIARSFKDSSIKVFEQENKGASAARNKGLRESKGEYIQFLDADDLLSLDKIELQVDLLNGKNSAIACCATIYFFDGGDPYSIQPVHEWYSKGSTDNLQFLIKLYGGGLIGPAYGGMITVHAWLCPKNVIDKAGKWNEGLTTDDDGEFFCRVILASRQIVYSPEALCYYRKYNGLKSLSVMNNYQAAKSLLVSTDLKAAYLLTRTTDKNAKLALARLYYDNAVSFYPKYAALSLEAENNVKALAPGFIFEPYTQGLSAWLSKFIGWKKVRYLQYLKYKFIK
ncbi:MAG: glycosyltransferase family 2 protein, partial [Sphingobacteriales bacterium]